MFNGNKMSVLIILVKSIYMSPEMMIQIYCKGGSRCITNTNKSM